MNLASPTDLLCSFRFRSGGRSSWALPGLLGCLVVFALGCHSTRTVSPNDPNAYREVTRETVEKTARVSLRGNRTVKLDNLYVDADSTMGVDPLGTPRAFPTAAVRKIEVTNRGRGFAQGIAIGGLPPLLLGAIQRGGAEGALERAVGAFTQLLAVPGAFVGGIVGIVSPHRDTYRFVHSEHSTNGDAGSAVSDSRLSTSSGAVERPE